MRVRADEQTHSPAEAGRRAHVSRATVQRLIQDGTIKAFRRGSHYRIPESGLERFRRQMWLDMMTALAANDDFWNDPRPP